MDSIDFQVAVDQAIASLASEFGPVYDAAYEDIEHGAYFEGRNSSPFGIVNRIVENDIGIGGPRIPHRLREAAQAFELFWRSLYRKADFCEALKSVSGDAFDVSKTVVPVLLTLKATGTIKFHLSPLAIALVCLIITKTGVAALCPPAKTPPTPSKKKRKKHFKR